MKPALELSPAAKGSIVFGLKWPGAAWQAPSWARFRLDELARQAAFFNRIALARPSLGYACLGRRLPPVICAALAVGAAFAAPAKVNDEAGDFRKWFAIPSQSLRAALQAYSQQSGVQVLYESNLAAGQTSANVEGSSQRQGCPSDALVQDESHSALRARECNYAYGAIKRRPAANGCVDQRRFVSRNASSPQFG